MANSQHRAPFPTSRSPSPFEIVRFSRCETCCRCLNKTLLTSCGLVCPFCHHNFCPDCVIDTVEDYQSKRNDGRPVIVHPTGPSHNCQFLLQYESERRQKFEEQEARSARRIRQARRDFSPYSVKNGVREVFDTESSSDEVQVISPLPPRRRVVSPRPPIRRPRRKAADTVDLRDGPEFSASKKRKVKAETPSWTMEPRLWEVPDELSTFPDYVQTSDSDTNAFGVQGRLPLREKLR